MPDCRLNDHIGSLPSRPVSTSQYNVVVVGGGLTGIEVAAEMFGKVRAAIAHAPASGLATPPRVILADHQAWIGSDMGESARPVIAEALQSLSRHAPAFPWPPSTREAHPCDRSAYPGSHRDLVRRHASRSVDGAFRSRDDRLGRLPGGVRRRGCRVAAIDGTHASVMSCQHAPLAIMSSAIS